MTPEALARVLKKIKPICIRHGHDCPDKLRCAKAGTMMPDFLGMAHAALAALTPGMDKLKWWATAQAWEPDEAQRRIHELEQQVAALTPAPTQQEDCGCNQEGEHGPDCPPWCDKRTPPPPEGEGELVKALEEIAKGEGAFSRDPLTHAENTIENMKAIAAAALARARGK